MKLVIAALSTLVLALGGLAWWQKTEIGSLQVELANASNESRARKTACDYLAGEVRSAVMMRRDHEMETRNDGTIVIFHKVTALALPFWLLLREFNSGDFRRPKFRILNCKLQRSKTVKFFEFSFTVS